jgi:uncharacterized protein YeeX (DUF496 family)
MSRLPDNIRQAVDMLGNLQQDADSLKALARNNKQASNNLATQVQAVLERVRQLGVSRDRMVRELQQEVEALLQTATQRQVEHLQNLREILESAVTHEDIQSIANQLQEALGGQPDQGSVAPPPEGGIEMQPLGPRTGGKTSKRHTYKKNKKGGYPRTPTKGEVEVGRSNRRRTKSKRKTLSKR